MMAGVVLLATIELGWILARDVLIPPLFLLEIGELLELFGQFLLVLIGIELMHSMKVYIDQFGFVSADAQRFIEHGKVTPTNTDPIYPRRQLQRDSVPAGGPADARTRAKTRTPTHSPRDARSYPPNRPCRAGTGRPTPCATG